MYLCSVEEGWSPPPSTVAHVSSQQTWVGSTRRDQEYLQRGCGKGAGGQVEHFVKWEEEGVMKTENCQHILSNQLTSSLLVVVDCPLGPLLHHQLQSGVIERVLQSNQQLTLNLDLVAPTIESELHNDVIVKVLLKSMHLHTNLLLH